mmetsp:Transcript_20906/g.51519  ORF Transcript_20906/g.51519 Transcript_20906/m.51519 type:complete len:201 (+) Transcript_20906:732-1334(+)
MADARSGASMTTECPREARAKSARGRRLSWRSSSARNASMSKFPTATRTTWLSLPCSACDSKSDTTKRMSAYSSATQSCSLGPAGISMATSASPAFCSIIFADVTNWLPGPAILSTLGQLPVPYAMAATAWAPPAASTWVTPHLRAQYRTSGAISGRPPSGMAEPFTGGVARTTVSHPAICAGMPSMRAVEGRTAVPPGT